MCRCTPELRTPFCGKPGCGWPEEKPPNELKILRDAVDQIVLRAWDGRDPKEIEANCTDMWNIAFAAYQQTVKGR